MDERPMFVTLETGAAEVSRVFIRFLLPRR